MKRKEQGELFRLTVGHANHEKPHNQKNGFALKLGETIGDSDCPLMRRWVFECPLGSLRLHHFLTSDDDRALHNHPWWFLTIPLKGGYTDVTYCSHCGGVEGGCQSCDGGYCYQPVKPFRPYLRRSKHAHAVRTEDCWTLIVTGRKRRRWGFFDRAGAFFESRNYFGLFGHPPCE